MAFRCIACRAEIEPSSRSCPHCGETISDFLRTYTVQPIDGKYQILERLGRGGMGEVYKVLHTRLGAVRVIKTMRAHLMEDASLRERFLREAKLATRIQHPNVAMLHDFSELPDGSFYMVWEYIEGTNLAAMIRREGTLNPRVAIGITIQALQGLEAIHNAGIIHRDISPENIMVFKEGSGSLRVKIIDLGIAKSEAVDGAVTRTGFFVGKWKYASPEHLGLLRDGLVIDGRADLFSLGIVLYEMLAGRPPYEATTPGQYFLLHSKDTPNPVTVHSLSFPEAPGLEQILARALEKDRDIRFSSAKEFADALSALLSKLSGGDNESTAVPLDVPTVAKPAADPTGVRTLAPVFRKKSGATRTLAIAGVIALALLVAGGELWFLYKRLTGSEAQQAATTPLTTPTTATPSTTPSATPVDVVPPGTTITATTATKAAPATEPGLRQTTPPATNTADPAATAVIPTPAPIVPTAAPKPPTRAQPERTGNTEKAPVEKALPPGDRIPNSGSFGRRSNLLMSSDEWKEGFQRGIISDYDDLYSGGGVDWASVARGEKLSLYKVVLGKLTNLSAYDSPKLRQSLQADLQGGLDKIGGAKGTLNAQIAVIWVTSDPRQRPSVAVEMIFRDAEGHVLAKLHHRTEARSMDGAIDDMVEAITKFVEDHSIVQ